MIHSLFHFAADVVVFIIDWLPWVIGLGIAAALLDGARDAVVGWFKR